jgi:hypothetical protein
MAKDFSFSRDFRNIRWGATLRYNMLRALCAGLVFTAIGLIFYNQIPNNKDNLSFILAAWIVIPIGYPFFYLPLGIALRFLGNFFSPFRFVAFCFASMIAIGDPLVFLLHKIVRNLVPVRKPAFLSFQMLIFVLDEGTGSGIEVERDGDIEVDNYVEPDTNVEQVRNVEPDIFSVRHSATSRRTKPSRSAPTPVKPPPSSHEPGSIDHLLDTCQREPHEGLAWIDRLSPELRGKATICFARFIALRTLGLGNVMGSVNLTGVETDELRRYLTPQSGKYIVQALQQISELEHLHPGYIASIGAPDDRFGESSMDDVCIVVERLFPGKVQEILGWTKIFYFGIDRIGFVPGLKDQIPHDLLMTLLRARFETSDIVRSAVAITYKRRGRDGPGYVDFYMCRLNYGETSTIGDAEILGTLRLSEDSSFTFTPE